MLQTRRLLPLKCELSVSNVSSKHTFLFTLLTVLAYDFRVLCFHTDLCTARLARLDGGLALNLLLLITGVSKVNRTYY